MQSCTFFLAHIRRLMIKFGDKSWFVLCFRPSSLLLTHTPAASSSSHRVARLAFPCVFQAVFLTQVILSPEGEIPFQGCKSSWRESPSFLPFFSACALKSHMPTAAITETFHATQRPLFSAMFSGVFFAASIQDSRMKL